MFFLEHEMRAVDRKSEGLSYFLFLLISVALLCFSNHVAHRVWKIRSCKIKDKNSGGFGSSLI